MIRNAKNGCSSDISFNYGIENTRKNIYHRWTGFPDSGVPISYLGKQLDKNEWITENVKDLSNIPAIQNLMIDWELYENGWLVETNDSGNYNNCNLYYYLCQIGNYGLQRPKELDFLKSSRKMAWC